MEVGITEKLAGHAFNVRYQDMPQEVIDKAKDCLLDQIGVELIGSTLDIRQ
jgi:2-methylcitrate dehydratase PrpD